MSEITELAEKLKIEGEKMFAFFAGLTDDQWTSEVYTEGETWTLRNVLSHFVTSEKNLVKLFERIRTTGEGSSEDFSIDRFNTAQQQRMKEFTPAELLEQYKEVRANSIAWVSGLKEEELEIKGRHPFLGDTVIREMIRMIYIHHMNHYRDVKRAMKST